MDKKHEKFSTFNMLKDCWKVENSFSVWKSAPNCWKVEKMWKHCGNIVERI